MIQGFYKLGVWLGNGTIFEESQKLVTRREWFRDQKQQCGQHPWTLKCFHHYNTGDWITLDHPRNWSQQFGYHKGGVQKTVRDWEQPWSGNPARQTFNI